MSIYTQICMPYDGPIQCEVMPGTTLKTMYLTLRVGEGDNQVSLIMSREQAEKSIAAISAAIEKVTRSDHCEECDGTGDIYTITGEWCGACHCISGYGGEQAS